MIVRGVALSPIERWVLDALSFQPMIYGGATRKWNLAAEQANVRDAPRSRERTFDVLNRMTEAGLLVAFRNDSDDAFALTPRGGAVWTELRDFRWKSYCQVVVLGNRCNIVSQSRAESVALATRLAPYLARLDPHTQLLPRSRRGRWRPVHWMRPRAAWATTIRTTASVLD